MWLDRLELAESELRLQCNIMSTVKGETVTNPRKGFGIPKIKSLALG